MNSKQYGFIKCHVSGIVVIKRNKTKTPFLEMYERYNPLIQYERWYTTFMN